jgi:hypothetical protein
MGLTISGSSAVAVTLTSVASNPVTVTGTLNPFTASGALYGIGGVGNTWTIDNSGMLSNKDGPGVQLGSSSTTVGAGSVITNADHGSIYGGIYGIKIFGSATVINNAGGTISGGLSGSIYQTSGALTVVNGGLLGGGSRSIRVNGSGSITNLSTGTISHGVDLFSAGTITNAGVLSGLVQFSASTSNRLIVDPGATVNALITGGAGVVELASGGPGTLSGFGTSITNFGTLQFDAGADWTVSGDTAGFGSTSLSSITGFASGDTIDLTGFVATSSLVSTNALVLSNGTGNVTLAIQGITSSNARVTNDGVNTFIVETCFVAGTHIATPSGEVAVESLTVGDEVLTQSGEARAITWIGKGEVLATRGQRGAATPVIVRKDAFADNVPNHDLHVTKGHSFYLDGALIPAEFLINHRSIVWDDQAQEVQFFHIELDTHDVLLANGAPAESYRDDGNRRLFQNGATGSQQAAKPPYAPVLTGGPVVDGVWSRLMDRSGPRPSLAMSADPDLHVVADNQRIDGRSMGNGVFVFRLPRPPASARVVSRAGAPDQLGLARDPRLLGVALRRITLWQGRHVKVIEADDSSLCEGFHAFEADNSFRWTNGDAVLPATLFEAVDGVCELQVDVGSTMQYPVLEDRAAIAA